MRDRFQIVHMRDDGSYDVLARSIPRDRKDRFTQCEQFALMLLRGRIVKAWPEGKPYNLTYPYISVDHPEDGIVGILEKD
jgi:hypothetical protein